MDQPKTNVAQIDVATVETTSEQPHKQVHTNENKKRNMIIGIISCAIATTLIIAIVLGVLLSNKSKPLDPFRASNLKKVIIIARHGARTSFENFPTEISENWQCDLPQLVSYEQQLLLLNDSTPSPCPPGELVANGYKEHKELGSRWKQRYIDTGFLSSTYAPEQVYLRTTNTSRTRASLLGQLSTMFPTTNQFTVEQGDNLNDGFHPPWPCKWQQQYQDENYANNLDLFPSLKEINKALKIDWVYDVIFDSLRAITGRGDQLPSVISEAQFQQISISNDHYWRLWFCNPNTTRADYNIKLTVGPMFAILRDIIENQPQRLFIISSHDTTVSPLMSALTKYDWECGQPPFASNIVIEMNLQDQVSVKYQDAVVTTLKCQDGSLCTKEEFQQLLTGYDVATGQDRLNLCDMELD